MKRDDLVVASLAALAVVLAVAVVLTASGRGPALAQAVDRTGGFVMAVGQFDQNRQAMFLVDERSGQMAVFTYLRGQRVPELTGVRDLRADFAIAVEPPGMERPEKPGNRP